MKRKVLARSLAWTIGISILFTSGLKEINAQRTAIQGHTQTIWAAQDGLPDQSVLAFAQSKDGRLWIGTKTGLLRFDGARFESFDGETPPPLLKRGINCLLSSRDGSIWIGTEGGGLLRYSAGLFQSYSTNEFIRAIREDRNGTIWVGADQGLFQVKGPSLVRVDGTKNIPPVFVRALAEDQQGNIWVGGTSLLEFHGNELIRQYPLPGGPSLNLVLSLFAAHDGTLWVGTLSGLHRLLPSGTMRRVAGASTPVNTIFQTSDGSLLTGTIGQGMFVYRSGRLAQVSTVDLPGRTIEDIFEDSENNVWLATRGGIVRLSRTPVSIVPFPGGADSEFETIYQDRDGSIWIAASTQLFRVENGLARPYAFRGLPGLRVRTLLRDREGKLWIGTAGSGLLRLSNGHIERFNSSHGLINDFVRVILQSHDGSIWAGTDGGLTRIGHDGSTFFDVGSGLAYFSITALLEDRNGGIWVGTSRGLSHISNGKIVHDVATQALRKEQLWSICEDAAGELWFGSSNGLYGYGKGRMVHLTTAQGLATNMVYQILRDTRGNIWLSGPNSVSRLRERDLDEFVSGAQARIRPDLYLDSHDLESAELYSGMQPGGIVTPQGDVWFPSNKGAVYIASDKIVSETTPPVAINQIIANGQLVSPAEEMVLKPGNERLEISYGAIRLRSQDGLRYRYKMDGLETWTEAFGRRTAYYTHLPAGKYRFRVQAFLIDNPNAVSEASVVIVQKPHIYATPWFLICCAFVVTAVVLLAHKIRMHQIRLRFHAITEERARMAREMHDTVIQGCVGISSLLEAASGIGPEDEPLRQHLLTYATDQIRSTIESAREAVWALRNTSSASTDAGALCRELAAHFESESGVPVRCNISGTPFALGDSATHEMMMSIREALANAVRHGRPSQISLDVHFSEHELSILIEDDGKGFDPDAQRPWDGHYGITGMKERTGLLGGTFEITSAPAHGTRVSIRVPRRQAVQEAMVIEDAGRGPSND